MVLIEPAATGGGVLLTMKRAGEVTITANARGECGTSTLHITAATEAQWQAGNARYNNMNPLPAVPLDGGIPALSASKAFDPPGMPPACTGCHGVTATSSFFRTSSSTPQQTGGFSDQELIDIVTKGVVAGAGDDTIIPPFVWTSFHTWSDIMGEQAQGMVVYLRSLSPAALGGIDFPGLTPPSIQGSGGSAGSSGPPEGGTSGVPAGSVPCGSKLCVGGAGSTGAPCCRDPFASQCGVVAVNGSCTSAPSPPP